MRSFLRSAAHIFRMSKKSDTREFLLYLRLVFIGIAVVGTIGFVVQYVSSLLKISFG